MLGKTFRAKYVLIIIERTVTQNLII